MGRPFSIREGRTLFHDEETDKVKRPVNGQCLFAISWSRNFIPHSALHFVASAGKSCNLGMRTNWLKGSFGTSDMEKVRSTN
jgi:hypothetical protein